MHHARPQSLVGALLAVALHALSGCGAGPGDSARPAATATAPAAESAATPAAGPLTTAIEAAQVGSATISGLFATPVTLQDGSYEGDAATSSGAASQLAVLMTPLVRLGELDAHPGSDAAAVVATNEGRSAERISLAIVGLVEGKPVSLATATVGDRVRVRDLRVSGRDVVLDVVETAPGESSGGGTQLARRVYRLEGSALTQVSSEITGPLSLGATTAGGAWTAVAIDGAAVEPNVTAPTLAFADGQFSGTTGCQPYTLPVTEPTPGTVSMGALAAARRSCPGAQGAVDRRFRAALPKATGYTFLAGRLVLSGLDGDQMRSVTLTRQP
ncbi:META domain-containing protein [Luteitalea sp.]|jgi:hypothetical protein|uniref:META domain-containing protein n=1 Tax=Luteitalea sp. TaxID=2004800 RepID=UPI0037CB058E